MKRWIVCLALNSLLALGCGSSPSTPPPGRSPSEGILPGPGGTGGPNPESTSPAAGPTNMQGGAGDKRGLPQGGRNTP